jgi:hypothetical protein
MSEFLCVLVECMCIFMKAHELVVFNVWLLQNVFATSTTERIA